MSDYKIQICKKNLFVSVLIEFMEDIVRCNADKILRYNKIKHYFKTSQQYSILCYKRILRHIHFYIFGALNIKHNL